MIFVRSLTVSRADFLPLVRLWERSGDPRAPFAEIILTPLPGLTFPSTISTIRQHLEGRGRIIFDSGGYAVQQGLLPYEDLFQRLLAYYRENTWADTYVLPDHVPTSGLTAVEVEECVNDTITVGEQFHAELPAALRPKVLPVVQGYTREHVLRCVDAYERFDVPVIGFGSFGTTGVGQDINMATRQSLDLLAYLTELGRRRGFGVHAFGVGSPLLLPVLHRLGVHSFDSSCWLRTAGFGNVFFPFMKRHSITGGRFGEKISQRPITASELAALREESEHACFFCESYADLKRQRFHQILHNLTVIMDMVESLNHGEYLESPILVNIVESSPYLRWAGGAGAKRAETASS